MSLKYFVSCISFVLNVFLNFDPTSEFEETSISARQHISLRNLLKLMKKQCKLLICSQIDLILLHYLSLFFSISISLGPYSIEEY